MGISKVLRNLSLIFIFTTQISGVTIVYAEKSNDTLVVALNKEIQTLDSLYSTSRESALLGHLVSDQLVVLNPETYEYEPALAESFEFVDSKTIEFVLRKGLKFHDGSDITVDDIIYSVEYVADKKSKTRRGNFIRSWLSKVEKVGPRTLRIQAKNPYPLMLRDISMFLQTRKKNIYAQNGDINHKAQTQSLIGTGPYKVTGFQMGKGVILERFNDYYKGGSKVGGRINKIILRPVPEWGTVVAEMMSNGVQWAYNVPDDIASDLGSTQYVNHVTGPSTRISFLLMDAKGATGRDQPLTKVKVRQALNHAIDRTNIVKNLVKGTSRVINAACFPGQFGCTTDVAEYPFDPAKAKQLLDEAGYPNGFEFDLWAYREKPVTEAIAADLAKIGVDANIRFVKLSALSKARSQHEIESYHGTWGFYGTPDVGAISNHFIEASDRNLTGDREVGELFKSALETTDDGARKAKYYKALKKIAENAYWVPLYQYTQNYVVSKDLSFDAPLDGFPRLNRMTWK